MAFLGGIGRPADLDTLCRKMQGSKVEVRVIGRDTVRQLAHRRASSSGAHQKSRRKGSEVIETGVVYVKRKSGDHEKRGKTKSSAESGRDVERGEITRKKSVRRTSVRVIGPDGLDRRRPGDDQRAQLNHSTSQRHTTLHHSPPSPSTFSNRPSLSRRKTTFTDTRKIHGPRNTGDPHDSRDSRDPPSASSRPPLQRSRSTRNSSRRSDQPSSRPSAHRPPSTSRHSKSSRPPSPPHYSTTTRRRSRPPSSPTTTRASKSQSKSQSRPNIMSLFGGASAAPEKELQCVACQTENPASETLTLHCKHHMCHDCLKRVFTLSLTDPQTMPPKCCEPHHPINPGNIDKIFTRSFKKKWNAKYEEATAKYRIYCPRKGCGEFIRPKHIHILPKSRNDPPGLKRKYGLCSKCRTFVCTTCSGKFHSSRECPKDPATLAFQKIAEEKGWQRCYNCKATVEHNKGCNHMTCRCNAEFCMVCGVKWKGCDCPMFNDEAVEEEHRRVMREAPGMPPPGGWFYEDEDDDWMGMGEDMGHLDVHFARLQTREAAARAAQRRVYNRHRVADFGGFDYRRMEVDAEALGRQVERDLGIHDYDYESNSSSDPESDSDLIYVEGTQRRDLAARRITTREEARRRNTYREEPRHHGYDHGGGRMLGGAAAGDRDGARRPGGGYGNFAGEGRRLDERGYDGGGGAGGGGRRLDGGRTRMRTASPPLNPHLGDDFFRRGQDILARPYNDQNDRDAGMLIEEINDERAAANRPTGRANAPPMRRASTLAGIGSGVASRARRAGNGGGLNGRVSEWRRYVD